MGDSDLSEPAAKRDIGRIVVATIAIICVVGVAWMLVELSRFFLLVFAAVVLAAIFDTITRQICRVPFLNVRWRALTLAIIGLLAVFVGAFYLFGAQLSREFETIQENIPAAMRSVEALLDQLGLGASVAQLVEQGTQDLSNLASRIGGYALAVTSGVADFVLVFVGAIFIAAHPDVYRRGLLLLLPHRARATGC
jgi:predicted PurR-regulated permease PerM